MGQWVQIAIEYKIVVTGGRALDHASSAPHVRWYNYSHVQCIYCSLNNHDAYQLHRCECFNSRLRNFNIFSNRAASSRDIAVRFTLLEDIRLMCDGGNGA